MSADNEVKKKNEEWRDRENIKQMNEACEEEVLLDLYSRTSLFTTLSCQGLL